jgi:hypothetical protein
VILALGKARNRWELKLGCSFLRFKETATKYRINQEIKFLYIKKNKLNEELYTKHLQCASVWPNCWPVIHCTIEDTLKTEMEGYYEQLNKKLDKLMEKQKQPPHPDHKQQQNCHPRTINLTNITFTREERALLDLGLQYNIQQPLKKYWTNLILETEKAIRLLETR